ncbi:ester cyclase [Thiolinea disciformis]|uniref:ester cyclase n=1 Tax=Thiolinea disciformis TaxID=125614 RepID=UPI000378C863|nr:ester cyclase [Thiolinea disciformis]
MKLRLAHTAVLLLSLWTAHSYAADAEADVNALVQKHYSAYSAGSDPAAILAQSTANNWQNCGANGEVCQTRDELVGALNGLFKLIPDLKWEVLETINTGDKIVVRGQGSGTPTGDFMGVPKTGKSFKIMSIDIHTLKDGKLAHTYHLEDWGTALKQLSGH